MTISQFKYHWLVAMKSSQLSEKPTVIKILDTDILLFRHNGKVVATNNLCPHRGAPLSAGCVKEGIIHCAYHGWEFSSDGCLLSIPGDLGNTSTVTPLLTVYSASDQGGYIWVKLSPQSSAIKPCLPEVHSSHPYVGQSDELNTSIADVLENFLDPFHTHFIHSGIIRSSQNKIRNLCHIQVSSINNGYEARYQEQGQRSGIISYLFGKNITESIGRLLQPGIVEVEYRSKKSTEMLIAIHITPITKDRYRIFIRTYLKPTVIPIWMKVPFLFPFQYIAFKQDKKILEAQKKALSAEKEFKPIKTNMDIMRKHIESVLKGELPTVVDSKFEVLI